MSRVRTLFVTVLPAAIAGGFLFASAFGHADAGRDSALGFWPAAASDASSGASASSKPIVVAQADPRPGRPRGVPVPPAPPSGPMPPAPPAPPAPPHRSHGHGTSISIHDGKIEIEGITELVQDSLEKAIEALEALDDSDIPSDVRAKLKDRIKAVRGKINGRLKHLKSMDLEQLGPELEKMGDEIERDMAGLDKDLAQLGDKVGKGFAKKFGKDFAKDFGKDFAKNFGPDYAKNFGPGSGHDGDDGDDDADDADDEDREAVVMTPDAEINAEINADTGAAIAALKGLSLDAGQRAQIAKLRADTDRQLAIARRDLDSASSRLRDTLRDGAASEDEIARQIDTVSKTEAAVRKVRILAWVKARNVLHKDQRKQIEAVVHHR